jgi:hypothetical protein
MKECPILFSTLMVQALLAGRKTMTRRKLSDYLIFNVEPDRYKFHGMDEQFVLFEDLRPGDSTPWVQPFPCPYGQIGDQLWVRETTGHIGPEGKLFYKADFPITCTWLTRLTASIHLKKENARIWLEISNIKIERLEEISENDAIAEGIICNEDGTYKNYHKKKGLREADNVEAWLPIASFQSLWCAINGLDSWKKNPWVWVVEFKILSTTGKPLAADKEGASV